MNSKKQALFTKILLLVMIGVLFFRFGDSILNNAQAGGSFSIGDYVTLGEKDGESIKWRVASVSEAGGALLFPADAVSAGNSFNSGRFAKIASISDREQGILKTSVSGLSATSEKPYIFMVEIDDMLGLEEKLNSRLPYNTSGEVEEKAEGEEEADVVESLNSGLVPAIVVNTAKVSELSGLGTKASPYVDYKVTGADTTTEVVVAEGTHRVGDLVNLQAEVKTLKGASVSAGKVEFYVDGEKVGSSVKIGEDGFATTEFKLKDEGVNAVTAKYLGSEGFFASEEDVEIVFSLVVVSEDAPEVVEEAPVVDQEETEIVGDTAKEESDFADSLVFDLSPGQNVTVYHSRYATACAGDKLNMRTPTSPYTQTPYWLSSGNYAQSTMGVYTSGGEVAFCLDLDTDGPQSSAGYTVQGLAPNAAYKAIYYGITNGYNQEAIARAVHIVMGKGYSWSQYGDAQYPKDPNTYIHNNVGLSEGREIASRSASAPNIPANGSGGVAPTVTVSTVTAASFDGTNYVGEVNVRYTEGATLTSVTSSSGVTLTPVGSPSTSGGYTTQKYRVTVPTSYTGSITVYANVSKTVAGGMAVYSATSPGIQQMAIVTTTGSSVQNGSGNGTFDLPELGQVTLTKTDTFTKQALSGCTFALYTSGGAGVTVTGSNGAYAYSTTGTATPMVTSASGKIVVTALQPGSYYFVETGVPTGYTVNATHLNFTASAGQNATVSMENEPQKGKITLNKSDGFTKDPLAGCTFALYRADGTGIVTTLTATGRYTATGIGTASIMGTDSSGVLEVSGVPVGNYYFREVAVPSSYYKLLTDNITVSVTNGGNAVVNVENQPNTGQVTLTKKDDFTGKNLAGCTFALYRKDGTGVATTGSNGSYVASGFGTATTMDTNASGVLNVTNIPVGDYYFKEVSVANSSYYLLNTEEKEFSVTTGGHATVEIRNVPRKGEVTLTKKDAVTGENLAGCTFKLFRELDDDGVVVSGSNGVYVATNFGTATVMATDSNGVLKITGLPIGDYYFKEESVPAGGRYELNTDEISVKVNTNANTSVTVENDLRRGVVNFQKLDAELDAWNEDLAESTFKMIMVDRVTSEEMEVELDGSSGTYVFKNTTMTSSAPSATLFKANAVTGITAISNLPIGEDYDGAQRYEYRIEEISSPGSYLIADPVEVSINPITKTGTVSMSNELQMVIIGLIKEGEFLEEGIEGKKEGYDILEGIFEHHALADAVFEVTAAEDIYTGSTLRHSEGDLIETLTTDANGEAMTGELFPGKYNVQEVEAPEKYELDETIYVVEAYDTTADSNDSVITYMVNEDDPLLNKLQNPSIEIYKEKEIATAASGAYEYSYVKAKGIVFGLYTNEEFYAETRLDDEDQPALVFPADALVDVVETDEEGKAVSTAKIPMGKYYFKELETLKDYVLLEDKFEIEVGYTDDHSSPVVVANEGEFVQNDLFKRKIQILKVDEDDDDIVLEGVIFEIKNEDGDVVATIRTDKNGVAYTPELPLGVYYAVEKWAPDGYIASDDEVKIEMLAMEEKAVEKIITNKKIVVELLKIDALTRQPLAGALIRVTNSSGEVIHEGRTGVDGKIILEAIPAGAYTFKELEAPRGYNLVTAEFVFAVDNMGVITGTTELENHREKEQLYATINKRDVTDGKAVPGATVEIYDENGIAIFQGKSDENGDVVFPMPEPGVYTFKEIFAPEGYTLNPQTFDFEITEDGIHKGVAQYDDDWARVRISKVDSATGLPLAGAEFGLFDEHNNLVRREVSGKDGMAVFDGLDFGLYLIKEIKSPEGYVLTNEVILVNTRTGKYTNSPAPYRVENTRGVKTGVDNNVILLGIVCLAAVAVMVMVIKKQKKASK